MAFLQGKVNDECKVKIREFQMLQSRFSKISTFDPPQIYTAVMDADDDPVELVVFIIYHIISSILIHTYNMNEYFRYDQLVLKKFVAEAYAKLVEVEVKRLNIPEKDFTGKLFP